jgi:uncharacterized membrane protein YfcA
MSLLLVAAIIFTSFLTAAISSMFGMLGGLILLAVLVNIMPVGEAMVLHGFIQLTSNGFRLWLNRQHVQWAIVGFFIIGGVVALSALAFVAFVPSRIMLLMALGLMPYLSLIIPKSWALDATKKPVATLAGGLIVMINLLSGVAGPLLDVFFQKTALTRHQVVATKAGVAILCSVRGLGKPARQHFVPPLRGWRLLGLPSYLKACTKPKALSSTPIGDLTSTIKTCHLLNGTQQTKSRAD